MARYFIHEANIEKVEGCISKFVNIATLRDIARLYTFSGTQRQVNSNR